MVVEPRLRLHTQAWLWSGGFLLFAALNYRLARQSQAHPAFHTEEQEAAPPSVRDRIVWLLLAACASGLLLAITNHITQNIAAIPLAFGGSLSPTHPRTECCGGYLFRVTCGRFLPAS